MPFEHSIKHWMNIPLWSVIFTFIPLHQYDHMHQFLANISLVVRDYDEAILYYTGVLGFDLVEDTQLSETKRWVRVKPGGSENGCHLLLARAATDAQRAAIGKQTGGRVFLFLHTDDFDRDYDNYRSRGVTFIREPIDESYGRVAVFSDLYGNLWDLIGPSNSQTETK
jgi:catechol 2,3-dioxygenase-like lactoylglutathione lyase family enzyme